MGSMLAGFLNSKLSIRNKKSYILNELELRYNSLLSLAYSLQNIKNNNLKKYTLLVILKNTRQLKTDREKVNVAHSSLCNLGFAETSLTKQYFELFDYLSSQNSFNWSNCYFEGREGSKNIFRAFNAAEWDSFLNLFVGKPDLGFHDVEILKVLADKYPNKILGYFKNRIQYDVAKLKGDRYSAVPYSDSQLHELFAKHEKDFVKQILKWYKDFEPWMVAHLLHDLYPTINQTLDKELRLLIDKKDKKIWKKRVSPLFTWYGKYEIEGIIEYTIRKFEKDESIWNECAAHLLNPGSVSGTAGEPLFANAIQGRVNSVKKWKQDTKKMKEFVALVEDWGSKRVQSELISHNKEIMERRREYSD
jgi:hypothetical protein